MDTDLLPHFPQFMPYLKSFVYKSLQKVHTKKRAPKRPFYFTNYSYL